jgi:hypothetical protein
MQQLDRVRISKIKIRTVLKDQIIGHLDRILPGLVIVADAGKERYTPMFASDFWSCQTMQHLIRVCPDPRQLAAMSTQELIDAFRAHSYAMGHITANKIITYARKVLLPDAELIAIRGDFFSPTTHQAGRGPADTLLEANQTLVLELEPPLACGVETLDNVR